MKKGDLVQFRRAGVLSPDLSPDVGLIVEVQARGPVPGAYVLWPNEEKTTWIKIESLIRVDAVVSQ